MNTARQRMTPALEKRVAALTTALRNAGLDATEVERRVRQAIDRAVDCTPRHEATNRYRGCISVTATARRLGMRRDALFASLEVEGWLMRRSDGWKATPWALRSGFVIERGSPEIRWPQLTPAGRAEIAHLLGITTMEFDHE